MMEGKENGHSGGGSSKFALEGKGNIPLVYLFLESLGITTGVARITEVSGNGHPTSKTWTGTGEIGALNIESILKSGGSGCLEVQEGSKRTTIFVNAGNESNRTTEPEEIDPSQSRMNI